MGRIKRSEILGRLREKLDKGMKIVGGGAGTGITGKLQESAGVDLLIVYNSGRYRMAGRGSLAGLLAYGNANDIVLDMAKEVLPIIRNTPVLAGVNATDPFFDLNVFLSQLLQLGFSGVQNFPTVGLIDGVFRQNLEETGMGFDKEVELIENAHCLDLLTTPYVFSNDDARNMAKAGADIIVCHLGLTTGGKIGAQSALTLDECVDRINEWSDAARSVRSEVILLCHGGPIAEPDDVKYIYDRTNIHGFYGASSMERLPVEASVTDRARAFVELTTQRSASLSQAKASE